MSVNEEAFYVTRLNELTTCSRYLDYEEGPGYFRLIAPSLYGKASVRMEQVDNNGTLHNSPCAGLQDVGYSKYVTVNNRYPLAYLLHEPDD